MISRIRKALDEKEEGFTLIELLVVIIIIGILAAIAIPVFLSQRKKGYDAQAKSDLKQFATLEETYLTDNPAGYGDALKISPDLKISANNVIVLLGTKGASGFCASVKNSASSNYFLYDSNKGGLQSGALTTAPTATASCDANSKGDTLAKTTLTADSAGTITVS
jgi:prepilin-type N-terminal cleavage/methylation domain-containing protein